MQACLDWFLINFGAQVKKKKRPFRPVFPDYLSVSYDYAYSDVVVRAKVMLTKNFNINTNAE